MQICIGFFLLSIVLVSSSQELEVIPTTKNTIKENALLQLTSNDPDLDFDFIESDKITIEPDAQRIWTKGKVKNSGLVATNYSGNIKVSFYHSNDTEYDNTDTFLSEIDLIVEDEEFAINLLLPNLQIGDNFILARIDEKNDLSEANEINNNSSLGFILT